MFFIKSDSDINRFTMINNKFFEKVLPYIDSNYAKIYLFSFYIAQHIDMYRDMDNEILAEILNMDIGDILQAWDFFESLHLIKKHRKYNANSKDFSVEFLDLDEKIEREMSRTDDIKPIDLINMENSSIKNMYERIEEITKTPLSHYEIKKIDSFLVNYSISYDVIVEAFKYAYFTKKKRSVTDALIELKEWINSGIKTSRELDIKLEEENKKYNLYRKILRRFGEYRLPTAMEMEYIDKWCYEYNFDYLVIKKAIDKSISIKNPNFRYIDGILTNWKNSYEKLEKRPFDEDKFSRFKEKVSSYFGYEIEGEDQDILKFIYKNYDEKNIQKAFNICKNKENPIKDSFDYLMDTMKEQTFGQIKLEDLKDIVNGNTPKYTKKNAEVKKLQKSAAISINDLYDEKPGEKQKRVLSKNKLLEFFKEVDDADKK